MESKKWRNDNKKNVFFSLSRFLSDFCKNIYLAKSKEKKEKKEKLNKKK